MECFLLGSGGMMPMPYRALTSLVVRVQGSTYLFDAGEGTQVALKKMALGIKNLKVIAITHLHGDHCLGVPGLLMMRAQVDAPQPLTILGPPGTEAFLSCIRDALGFHLNYPIRFIEWNESTSSPPYLDEKVSIYWSPLVHTTLCLGYRLQEHLRPGKFDVQKARKLGIPEGPLWGMLQNGEEVKLDDGRIIRPEEVLGPPRRGRVVCFAIDTRPCRRLYELCAGSDLAFLDGMFSHEHKDEARLKGHMTVVDASRIAAKAKAARVVMVHLSPRYKEDSELEFLQQSALLNHPRAEVGRDLTIYTVPLPRDLS